MTKDEPRKNMPWLAHIPAVSEASGETMDSEMRGFPSSDGKGLFWATKQVVTTIRQVFKSALINALWFTQHFHTQCELGK